jgi:hypothetical protein
MSSMCIDDFYWLWVYKNGLAYNRGQWILDKILINSVLTYLHFLSSFYKFSLKLKTKNTIWSF